MIGEVVEVVHYTPGLQTGERFIIASVETFLRQPMVRVRRLSDGTLGAHAYWAWRFRRVLGDAREAFP